jgi:DMSO/TMAO reductase YedYZ molybdopterin-dependent catalytic subunit
MARRRTRPVTASADCRDRNEQFSIRSHFEVPMLDVTTWRLQIAGAVERPVEIGYNTLRQMPAHTVTALLECSGNSRVFLQPPQVSVTTW